MPYCPSSAVAILARMLQFTVEVASDCTRKLTPTFSSLYHGSGAMGSSCMKELVFGDPLPPHLRTVSHWGSLELTDRTYLMSW